jgi:hypothetical protein
MATSNRLETEMRELRGHMELLLTAEFRGPTDGSGAPFLKLRSSPKAQGLDDVTSFVDDRVAVVQHHMVRRGDPTGTSSCGSVALKGRRTSGGPVTLHVYVEDVDAVFARALAAGARELPPVADQFYGDRSGMFVDPFGHQWNVASHTEDVSAEEMHRRAAEVMRQD